MTIRVLNPPNAVVLDTNVVSELMRRAPQGLVTSWVASIPPASIFTTAITVAEVRFGIARLPAGRRRGLLGEASKAVFSTFADRIWAFDIEAATHYADIVVEREHMGAPISAFDAQIAAICRAQGATLATRNTGDFKDLGIDLINPWESAT